MPGIGLGLGVVASKAPGGFSDEYQTVYDSFTIPPSDEIAAEQDKMVRALVGAGVWAKRDIIYLFAQTTDAAAKKNWISPGTYNYVNNLCSFAALEGYIGGTPAYGRTQFTPSLHGVKFAQNDASIAAYQRTDAASTGMMWGCRDGTNGIQYLPYYSTTGNGSGTINDYSALSWTATTSNKGWIYIERTGAAAREAFIDGVSKGSDTQASTGRPAEELHLFVRSTSGVLGNYGDGQLSYWACGGALSATEREAERAAVKAYMASNSKDTLP